jgi:hypothetical protein
MRKIILFLFVCLGIVIAAEKNIAAAKNKNTAAAKNKSTITTKNKNTVASKNKNIAKEKNDDTAEEKNIISFNIIYLDSTGKSFFTYPAALPNQAALQELQKNFIKQKFGESFLEQEPAAILPLFVSQNKEISHLSDAVSFPFPGIVQFATSYYSYPPGGAHGINGFDIGIYTFTDGKKIELASIFNKDWEKDITKLIIKEFLLSQNLQSLIDYDYTQKESDFVPRIVRLSGDGLEFVFPVYQIAPYGAGVQNVFLSWNSLKPYLNKMSAIYKRLQF